MTLAIHMTFKNHTSIRASYIQGCMSVTPLFSKGQVTGSFRSHFGVITGPGINTDSPKFENEIGLI